MSVSAVSASAIPPQSSFQANAQQFKTAFDSLSSAVQSGDMTSAQTALATLQQLQPGNGAQNANAPNDPLKSDMDALSKAIQSGDAKSAQSALTQLQSDMKAMGKGHHGHHHAKPAADTASSSTSSTSSASDPDANNATAKGILA